MPNPRGWRYWLEASSVVANGSYAWRGVLMLPDPIQFHREPLNVCRLRASRGYDDDGSPGGGGKISITRLTPLPPHPVPRISADPARQRWHYLVRGLGLGTDGGYRYIGIHASDGPWVGADRDVVWARDLIEGGLRPDYPDVAFLAFQVHDVVPLPPWPPH